MIDESDEEKASLYVLGLLDETEASGLLRKMDSDAELRSSVQDLQEAAAHLAFTAPPRAVPHHIRAAVLASINRDRETPASGTSGRWLPWLVAAAIAIVAGTLGWDRNRLRSEIESLRHQDHLAQIRIATLVAQVEGAPNSVGSVAWDKDNQRGMLTIEKLPPLGPGQDYQLWVIDATAPKPISGGIIRVAEDGTAKIAFTVEVPIRNADKFAVSRESKGGAQGDPGPIVLLGQ